MARARSTVAVGGVPRVDLLPPEITARARDRAAQSWVVLLLVVAVGIVVLGVGYAFVQNATAQVRLLFAQTQTQALQSEQEQYGEVRAVQDSIVLAEEARTVGASSEILWSPTLAALLAVRPGDVELDSATLSFPAPWSPASVSDSPLAKPRVASVTLLLKAGSIESLSAFVAAVSGREIVANAELQSVTGPAPFTGTVVIDLTDAARSDRFLPASAEAGADAGEATATPSPVETPTPEPTDTGEDEG